MRKTSFNRLLFLYFMLLQLLSFGVVLAKPAEEDSGDFLEGLKGYLEDAFLERTKSTFEVLHEKEKQISLQLQALETSKAKLSAIILKPGQRVGPTPELSRLMSSLESVPELVTKLRGVIASLKEKNTEKMTTTFKIRFNKHIEDMRAIVARIESMGKDAQKAIKNISDNKHMRAADAVVLPSSSKTTVVLNPALIVLMGIGAYWLLRHYGSKKKSNAQPRVQLNNMKAIQKIVLLNGLMRESQALARQVNHPLNALLFVLLKEGLDAMMGDKEKLLQYLHGQVDQSPFVMWPALLAGVFFKYVAYYKLWQWAGDIFLKIFPNGLFFDRKKNALLDFKQPISSAHVDNLIQKLTSLTQQQQRAYRRHYCWVFLVSIVLPFFKVTAVNGHSIISTADRVSIATDHFGLFLAIQHSSLHETGFVWNMAVTLQRLPVYAFLWKRYTNRGLQAQLEKHRQQLNQLSAPFEWRLATVDNDTKNKAVFILCQDQIEVVLLDFDEFLDVLQESFLSQGAPVFRSDDALYIGYHPFNMKPLKKMIDDQVARIEGKIKESNEKCRQLNQLNQRMNLGDFTWSSGVSKNDGVRLEAFYSLDVSRLGVVPYVNLRRSLAGIPGAVIHGNKNILLNLEGVSELNVDNIFDGYQKRLAELHLALPISHDVFKVPRKNKTRKSLSDYSTIESVSSDQELDPIPGSVVFSRGVTFFKSPVINSGPKNLAYLLHMPYLPEGHAYGFILAELFSQFAEHVSEKQIRAQLEKGMVHGRGAKTKVGSVGIQITNERYTTIHGEKDVQAALKVKVDNIRVFGRFFEAREVQGAQRRLYQFDGWRFGH